MTEGFKKGKEVSGKGVSKTEGWGKLKKKKEKRETEGNRGKFIRRIRKRPNQKLRN